MKYLSFIFSVFVILILISTIITTCSRDWDNPNDPDNIGSSDVSSSISSSLDSSVSSSSTSSLSSSSSALSSVSSAISSSSSTGMTLPDIDYFDSGIDNWSFDNWNATGSISYDTMSYHTAPGSMMIDCTIQDDWGFVGAQLAFGNDDWTGYSGIRFWCYSEVGFDDSTLRLVVTIKETGDTNQWDGFVTNDLSLGGWQLVEILWTEFNESAWNIGNNTKPDPWNGADVDTLIINLRHIIPGTYPSEYVLIDDVSLF